MNKNLSDKDSFLPVHTLDLKTAQHFSFGLSLSLVIKAPKKYPIIKEMSINMESYTILYTMNSEKVL